MIKQRLIDKVIIMLYSSLAGLKFNLGGQLGVNELLAFGDGLSVKKWRNLYREIPDARKISLAYIIFLLAQVVSDMVNHSSPANFIRGWANIAMALVVTSFLLRYFSKSVELIVFYLAGELIRIAVFGQDTEGVSLEDMSFFKFELVPVINAGILIITWILLKRSEKNMRAVMLLFVLYGFFSVAFDARSNGVFWILTCLMLSQSKRLAKITLKKALPYLFIFLLIFQGLYSWYVSSVFSGKIGGEHAKDQFEHVANPYNPLNLLVVGRAETVVALTAIADSPVWGHGSWAPDKNIKYTFLLYQIQGREDKLFPRMENTEGELLIPSHSVLAGAWASAGVVGFLAVTYVFLLSVARAFSLLKNRRFRRSPAYPIIIYFFFNLIWTFMFSPLAHLKQTLPVMIAFVIVVYQKNKQIEITHRLNMRNTLLNAKTAVPGNYTLNEKLT